MKESLRTCQRCREDKELSEFRIIHRSGGTRPFGYCKVCEREYAKEYRQRNKEKVNAYRRGWMDERRSTPEGLEAVREYQRRQAAAWRAANPDRLKRLTAERYQRTKSDKKAYQKIREDARIGYRLRKEREKGSIPNGKQPHNTLKFYDRDVEYPVGPFRDYLLGIIAEFAADHKNREDVARLAKTNTRQIDRYLNQNTFVRRSEAEKIMWNLSLTPFTELYDIEDSVDRQAEKR